MTEAYVYDAVRTPRGKGKKHSALHSIKPVTLMADTLRGLQAHRGFFTRHVHAIVLGVVSPVGEQGGDIAGFPSGEFLVRPSAPARTLADR